MVKYARKQDFFKNQVNYNLFIIIYTVKNIY